MPSSACHLIRSLITDSLLVLHFVPRDSKQCPHLGHTHFTVGLLQCLVIFGRYKQQFYGPDEQTHAHTQPSDACGGAQFTVELIVQVVNHCWSECSCFS